MQQKRLAIFESMTGDQQQPENDRIKLDQMDVDDKKKETSEIYVVFPNENRKDKPKDLNEKEKNALKCGSVTTEIFVVFCGNKDNKTNQK